MAFCKLLLGDVNVEILLISLHFLVIFWMRLPSTHSFIPSFFGIWKLFRRYISGSSFIYVSFVVPEFSNFKCFRSSRKYHFRLLLSFFGDNPLECGQICFKFCLPMQCKVMHQIFDSFYSILKKWSKLGEKTDFLAHFLEIFSLHTLTPYHLGPNLLPN